LGKEKDSEIKREGKLRDEKIGKMGGNGNREEEGEGRKRRQGRERSGC